MADQNRPKQMSVFGIDGGVSLTEPDVGENSLM